jgi:hypothetical protein
MYSFFFEENRRGLSPTDYINLKEVKKVTYVQNRTKEAMQRSLWRLLCNYGFDGTSFSKILPTVQILQHTPDIPAYYYNDLHEGRFCQVSSE